MALHYASCIISGGDDGNSDGLEHGQTKLRQYLMHLLLSDDVLEESEEQNRVFSDIIFNPLRNYWSVHDETFAFRSVKNTKLNEMGFQIGRNFVSITSRKEYKPRGKDYPPNDEEEEEEEVVKFVNLKKMNHNNDTNDNNTDKVSIMSHEDLSIYHETMARINYEDVDDYYRIYVTFPVLDTFGRVLYYERKLQKDTEFILSPSFSKDTYDMFLGKFIASPLDNLSSKVMVCKSKRYMNDLRKRCTQLLVSYINTCPINVKEECKYQHACITEAHDSILKNYGPVTYMIYTIDWSFCEPFLINAMDNGDDNNVRKHAIITLINYIECEKSRLYGLLSEHWLNIIPCIVTLRIGGKLTHSRAKCLQLFLKLLGDGIVKPITFADGTVNLNLAVILDGNIECEDDISDITPHPIGSMNGRLFYPNQYKAMVNHLIAVVYINHSLFNTEVLKIQPNM